MADLLDFHLRTLKPKVYCEMAVDEPHRGLGMGKAKRWKASTSMMSPFLDTTGPVMSSVAFHQVPMALVLSCISAKRFKLIRSARCHCIRSWCWTQMLQTLLSYRRDVLVARQRIHPGWNNEFGDSVLRVTCLTCCLGCLGCLGR